MKLLDILPTFIILIISATAFASGFYQSNLNTQVNNLNDDINSMKLDQTKINNKYQLIYNEFVTNNQLQSEAFDKAAQIDWTIAAYRLDGIPLNQTQIDNYVAQMIPYWSTIIQTQENNIIVKLYRYFELGKNQNPYVFASKANDGYDYNITISDWNQWQSSTGSSIGYVVSILNLTKTLFQSSDLIIPYFFKYHFLANPITHDNQTFILKTAGEQKLDTIFLAPSRELTSEINVKQQQINNLESRIKLVTQGVSIVAIATILGGIMVNRISDRQSTQTFDQIKKSLNIIQEVPQQHKDLISIPVLVIAGILSIFGLLLPLLI